MHQLQILLNVLLKNIYTIHTRQEEHIVLIPLTQKSVSMQMHTCTLFEATEEILIKMCVYELAYSLLLGSLLLFVESFGVLLNLQRIDGLALLPQSRHWACAPA